MMSDETPQRRFDPLDIGELVGLRIVLAMPDGPALTKEWTWQQIMDGESPGWIHDGPPNWLMQPEMLWRDPRLPIIVRGNVPPNMEQAARELLFGGRDMYPREEESKNEERGN